MLYSIIVCEISHSHSSSPSGTGNWSWLAWHVLLCHCSMFVGLAPRSRHDFHGRLWLWRPSRPFPGLDIKCCWQRDSLCVWHFSTLYVSHFSHFYHFLSFYVVPSCPFTFDFREIFSLFNHLPIIDRIRRKLVAITVWPVKAAGLPQLTSDCPACLT